MDVAHIHFDNENTISHEVENFENFMLEVKIAKGRFYDLGDRLINLDRVTYISKKKSKKVQAKPAFL